MPGEEGVHDSHNKLFIFRSQITTTGSCGFLITKVFYYNVSRQIRRSAVARDNIFHLVFVFCLIGLQWPAAAQPVFQVLLIIVSCVLAWGEAWFLDCRVIPKEKHAQRFFRAMMVNSTLNESNIIKF